MHVSHNGSAIRTVIFTTREPLRHAFAWSQVVPRSVVRMRVVIAVVVMRVVLRMAIRVGGQRAFDIRRVTHTFRQVHVIRQTIDAPMAKRVPV